MIGTSKSANLFIHSITLCFSVITPLSVTYWSYVVIKFLISNPSPLTIDRHETTICDNPNHLSDFTFERSALLAPSSISPTSSSLSISSTPAASSASTSTSTLLFQSRTLHDYDSSISIFDIGTGDMSLFHQTFLWNTILPYWFLLEIAFLIYFRYMSNKLQAPKPRAALSKQSRMKLFKNIISSEMDLQDCLSGWFLDKKTRIQLRKDQFSEIRKDNLKEWYAWAFFSSCVEELRYGRPDESSEELLNELDGMVKETELALGHVSILAGYNKSIDCIKLSYDPVQSIHRPLILYTVASLSCFSILFLHFFFHT